MQNEKCKMSVCLRHVLFQLIVFLLVLITYNLVLAPPSHAALKDLTINADKVSYDRANQRVEATGSVEAVYRDVILTGQHLVYNTSAETFHADHGFNFLYNGMTLEGETLDYAIVTREGVAEKVKFTYSGVLLGGERLRFNGERDDLTNASFTTCDLPEPHYHVTAADITLYPLDRWLVAHWGYFWLGRVPVVPMPTYIYDFSGEKSGQTPFPDLGSNDEDGSYITETLAWNLRRNLNGTYSLGYLANKGVGLGGTANYLINDGNSGNVRLNWNAKDNTYGGITHVFSFGNKLCEVPRTALDFGLLPCYRQYELELTLSSRERINYQRVSFFPEIEFFSRGNTLLRPELQYEYELDAGHVAEEGNTRMARGGGKFKLFGTLPESAWGTVTPSFLWDSLYYSNGARWVKPSVGFDLDKTLRPGLAAGAGYTHYLYFDGISPFNYEIYRYRAADLLAPRLLFKLGETRCRIAAAYYLDNWSPEDIDYTLFFILHCYNLEVTYRSLRNEFTLGFSLAAP
jgi:hypothetical protein